MTDAQLLVLKQGELDAVYEMCTRITEERDAARQRADAAEQERDALRAAGEQLWVELEDAAFGFEGVHWKTQRDAPPALDAWRAIAGPDSVVP